MLILHDSSACRVSFPSCDRVSVDLSTHREHTLTVGVAVEDHRESCHQTCEEWKSHCTHKRLLLSHLSPEGVDTTVAGE